MSLNDTSVMDLATEEVGQVVQIKTNYLYRFVKRSFDIVASFFGILLLGLPMICVALAVKCSSKGPALFRQKRCGKDNKPFTLLKFRSMYIEAPADLPPAALADADAMITKVGKFIRKTSLDELPQLFNIFLGQMSVIGPRPAQVVHEEELVALRNSNGASCVRPGLTGWAQVNGRDVLAADVPRKAAYDGWYAQHAGIGLDIKIFFLTIAKVLKSSDIVEGDRVIAMASDQVFAEMPAVAAEAAAADRAVTADAEVVADRGVEEMPTGVAASAAAVDVPLAEEVAADAASADESFSEEPAVLIDVREEPVLEPCAEVTALTDEEVFGTAPAGSAEALRPEREARSAEQAAADTVKIA